MPERTAAPCQQTAGRPRGQGMPASTAARYVRLSRLLRPLLAAAVGLARACAAVPRQAAAATITVTRDGAADDADRGGYHQGLRETARAELSAIIAARAEGVRYICAHPDAAADIVAETYQGNAAPYRRVLQNFARIRYWDEGELDYAGMDRMVEGPQIIGKQKSAMDWKKVVDTAFLPKDLQSKSK